MCLCIEQQGKLLSAQATVMLQTQQNPAIIFSKRGLNFGKSNPINILDKTGKNSLRGKEKNHKCVY